MTWIWKTKSSLCVAGRDTSRSVKRNSLVVARSANADNEADKAEE